MCVGAPPVGVMTPPQWSPGSDGSLPPAAAAAAAQEKFLVAVRVRPLRNNENRRALHVVDDKMLVMEDDSAKLGVLRQKRPGDRQYVFDFVFKEESSQEEVYSATTRPLVSDVLDGYNATVFAYGATGSGKTHTMVGEPSSPGVMVRALNDLFLSLGGSEHPDQFKVTMSYMEIYNESIRDLLNPSSGFLELREDSRGRGVQVAKLTEVSTTSTDQVMSLLQKGNRSRTMEPTAANQTSSRSHALLSVTVRHTAPRGDGDHKEAVRQGKLFMIDLAGSERASHTLNSGKRLQEGAHINRSLLALGNCINALYGGARFVNYRDSKLTRLLKDALSGNCRTVMVAHVSPYTLHREESRTTLLYAERASNISKKVERNVLSVSFHVSQYRAIISDLREEVSRLRARMGANPRFADKHRSAENLARLKQRVVTTFGEQMRLRRKLMDLDAQLLNLAAESENQMLNISMWESRHNKLYRRRTPGPPHAAAAGEDPQDKAEQQAWDELAYIEKETERCMAMRERTERELEKVRQQAVKLEDELPRQTSSEEERELLGLVCRVHELEADKLALQSERLSRQHELRRRDRALLRFDRQRQICEEIITRQRRLMEEGSVAVTPDLQQLYRLYQTELQATAYTGLSPTAQLSPYSSNTAESNKDKLPPISHQEEQMFQRSLRLTGGGRLNRTDSDVSLSTPSSPGDSERSWSPLPPVVADRAQHGRGPALTPAAVEFPALAARRHSLRLAPDSRGSVSSFQRGDHVTRLPRPEPRSSMQLERTSSDDNLSLKAEGRKARTRSRWRQ
ncbi:kinesin-like protein KIF19 isoform X1 [Bacillus rossius redtenbacheri]|uniref:kinesin-like protein KIF19 isoform X1 n=1 Tax=Bacillus rossius redtenbacheri TaxID=93214 RepID=UPI002FDCDD26